MDNDRLKPGDLVRVFTVFNDNEMDWDECDKVALVLGINDHEDEPAQYSPKETFVTLMMDGTVYEHEYYESELQKIQ